MQPQNPVSVSCAIKSKIATFKRIDLQSKFFKFHVFIIFFLKLRFCKLFMHGVELKSNFPILYPSNKLLFLLLGPNYFRQEKGLAFKKQTLELRVLIEKNHVNQKSFQFCSSYCPHEVKSVSAFKLYLSLDRNLIYP